MTLLTWKLQSRMATITSIDARSMNPSNGSGGTARGSRPTLSGYAFWIATTHTCLIIAVLVMAWGAICWCRPAWGAELKLEDQTSVPTTPLSFDDSVNIAIHRSPYFTKSSLEIDIRRMDETDSRYDLIPPLTFQTYYYVNRPSGVGNSKPYSLSFSTVPYNPLGAYFALQAQKLATQVAILAHLGIISVGLEKMGRLYLELDALDKLAGYQKDLIKLAQENLTYAKNRMSIGTGTSLEVKVVQGELHLAQGEQETIALARERALSGLKNLLGLPSSHVLIPNARDSEHQVLGQFNPATASLEQAKDRSYELKSLEIQKKLQGYKVSLAIAQSLPTILFNTQTPDPLSVSTAQGLYVGFGLQLPVWDGFKRIRNVSRQKAALRQIGAKKTEKEDNLAERWLEVLGRIQEKRVAVKNAQTREELARLKAHQKEIRYQSGQAPLPEFLAGRREVLLAQKDAVRKGLAYDKDVLYLRMISGDLGNTYVDAKTWQK
jgi:outer membrane protein TolC